MTALRGRCCYPHPTDERPKLKNITVPSSAQRENPVALRSEPSSLAQAAMLPVVFQT